LFLIHISLHTGVHLFFKKLIIGLLSFWAFEIKQSSRKFDYVVTEIVYERELEDQKKRETKKRKERHYPKGKKRRKTDYKVKSYSYRESRPRDQRFSNQQKLRRMFRNS
jgi:hypothetical protein